MSFPAESHSPGSHLFSQQSFEVVHLKYFAITPDFAIESGLTYDLSVRLCKDDSRTEDPSTRFNHCVSDCRRAVIR